MVFAADNALCVRCNGGLCQGNDCMDQITVDRVAQAARQILSDGEMRNES